MKTKMNQLTVILGLFTFCSVAAFADEVVIEANIGDKTSRFQLKPEHGNFVMSYQSNYLQKAKTNIGKKNYDYVVRVVNGVIASQQPGSDLKSLNCNRDRTLVQYTNDAGKIHSTKVCLFGNSPASHTIMNLINTMSAGI